MHEITLLDIFSDYCPPLEVLIKKLSKVKYPEVLAMPYKPCMLNSVLCTRSQLTSPMENIAGSFLLFRERSLSY